MAAPAEREDDTSGVLGDFLSPYLPSTTSILLLLPTLSGGLRRILQISRLR